MKFRPMHDKLLVTRLEAKTMTPGGLIIPDAAIEKSASAKVVSVGSGKILESGRVQPMLVKSGDVVVLAKWSGTEIKMEGEEYLIVSEDDVLGVES